MHNKTLTERDYRDAAISLRCDIPSIKAVAAVESLGGGFLPDGRPKILYEAHVFSRLTGGRFNRTHPHLSSAYWNRSLYGPAGVHQHNRLAEAAQLHRDAALQSTSWGMFQIMGFNWKACAFASLQDFINAMYRDERSQLLAFAEYVKHRRLDDELRAQNWPAFARAYNGPGYAENRYDKKLAAAYKRFS